MHKGGIIRYANYTVCASVFIHFCMQRKNNENIPIIIRNFGLFCLFVIGRDVLSSTVPQSEYTANAQQRSIRGICVVTTKTQVFASIICLDWRV